jgi:hypothetical protein
VEYVGRIEVTQYQQKPSLNDLPQVYDTSFKDWITQQAPAILPVLLPGAKYEATLDIEIIRPPMRVDKVFKILYHGKEKILHLEFEAKYDSQLKSRLLVYNAVLHRDHRLPVITIVVYPFRVTKAVPPLRIPKILTFHFKTLALFELDAEDFVRQHHASMYPLLPTMNNVHADLIDQVTQELAELHRDDEATLSQQIFWLKLLLERTDTVPDIEKEQIKERLSMFDQLFEESPMIQKLRQQYFEQGEMRTLQRTLINIVRTRYPDLAELAQQQAGRFDKPDVLELLIQQVVATPDANTARWLLESSTGK